MGGGSWTAPDTQASVRSYTKSVANTTSVNQVFRKSSLSEILNPKGVIMRESCDDAEKPESTPIIVGLDVTGSMGSIAMHIAKQGLDDIMTSIFEREPVTNPQVMFMGIGDALYDDAPLQVSQFEADFRIVEQLSNLYVERGGGGNDTESYDLPWYFAAHHTKIDSFEKRGQKGYIFTMGDETAPEVLRARDLNRIMGTNLQQDVDSVDSLRLASEKYHVFHLIIEEGYCARTHFKRVKDSWQQLMHNRAIFVDNYYNVSQIIISVIQVSEGADPEQVANSWDDASVQKSVRHALNI